MKAEFKCPWCGNSFRNGRDLDAHAKSHYVLSEPQLEVEVVA
ncbi:MAG: hypothetical protein ACE14S_08635 [Candidatus Bathyarchaeia archaeon]